MPSSRVCLPGVLVANHALLAITMDGSTYCCAGPLATFAAVQGVDAGMLRRAAPRRRDNGMVRGSGQGKTPPPPAAAAPVWRLRGMKTPPNVTGGELLSPHRRDPPFPGLQLPLTPPHTPTTLPLLSVLCVGERSRSAHQEKRKCMVCPLRHCCLPLAFVETQRPTSVSRLEYFLFQPSAVHCTLSLHFTRAIPPPASAPPKNREGLRRHT